MPEKIPLGTMPTLLAWMSCGFMNPRPSRFPVEDFSPCSTFTRFPVEDFSPWLEFKPTSVDGLGAEDPEPFPPGEGTVDRSKVFSENHRERAGVPCLRLEAAAGRLAGYHDFHIQQVLLASRTRLTWESPASVVPVGIAKLAHVAVPTVLTKNSLRGKSSELRRDGMNSTGQLLFSLRQQALRE
jgi:hypothetical protein